MSVSSQAKKLNLKSFVDSKNSQQKTVLLIGVLVGILIITAGVVGIVKTVTPHEETDADFSSASIEQGKKEAANFPIVTHLPINNAVYSLGYQFSDNGSKLTIKLKTTEAYLDDAINKLLSFNIDLTSVALEISAPDNPFISQYIMNEEVNPSVALRSAYRKIRDFKVVHVEYINSNNEATEFSQATAEAFNSLNYAIAKITTGSASTYDLQTYRIVLKHNEDNQWLPVANPAPILNIYNMPGVPANLLSLANKL